MMTMVMKLRIQNMTFASDSLFSSSNLWIEQSTGTSYCGKLLPNTDQFPTLSGVGNGVEIMVDLETFDNGNINLYGDGLDVLVTDVDDYSLTELHGFSAAPGTAVEIKINPVLHSITEAGLNNFDYLERKCVDTEIDEQLDNLDGMAGNYSLSNCLVSATLTQIYKRYPTNQTSRLSDHKLSRCPDGEDLRKKGLAELADNEGVKLQCINSHMKQVTNSDILICPLLRLAVGTKSPPQE